MYYRLNSDGSVLDYSKSKYHSDCLYTEEKIVVTAEGAVYLESSAPKEPYAVRKMRISKELSKTTALYMDTVAQEYGYDDCKTACTYIDTGVLRFDAEGKAFRQWRSAVWDKCFDILADVVDEGRAMPTEEELIAELPELKVTYG